jgi:hypothetical protein
MFARLVMPGRVHRIVAPAQKIELFVANTPINRQQYSSNSQASTQQAVRKGNRFTLESIEPRAASRLPRSPKTIIQTVCHFVHHAFCQPCCCGTSHPVSLLRSVAARKNQSHRQLQRRPRMSKGIVTQFRRVRLPITVTDKKGSICAGAY